MLMWGRAPSPVHAAQVYRAAAVLEGKFGKGTNSFVPSTRQNETRASAPEVSFAALTKPSPLRTTTPPRKCLAFFPHKSKKEPDCEEGHGYAVAFPACDRPLNLDAVTTKHLSS
jgi:hypothetical protein